MNIAVSPDAVPALVVRCLPELCELVDDLPREGAGELALTGIDDGTAQGIVFVERGRVCWAAARGLARRLTDILASFAGLDAGAMEALYETCKTQATPLGEHLVASGLVAPSDLRSALLQHTSESLKRLLAGPLRAVWTPRRRGGYSARFAFSTPELAAYVASLHEPEVAARARAVLGDAFREGEWGAAFLRRSGRAWPDLVAVCGDALPKMNALLRVARWACSVLDVSELAHSPDALAAANLGGSSLVAWRAGALTIAGSTGLHGPARLLNRRARTRRAEGQDGVL